MEYENLFVKEVKEKNITNPSDILNWYRNLYHTEDNHTEHGIVAYAINDLFADVVPKSEVERLKAVMEEMNTQRAYTINMLGESLEKAKTEIDSLQNDLAISRKETRRYLKRKEEIKTEVARDIFVDIDRLLRIGVVEHLDCLDAYVKKGYAELKKKYTEGEEREDNER